MPVIDMIKGEVGDVLVRVSPNHRGWNPEELADMAVDKIMYIAEQANVPIPVRDQCHAFKERLKRVLADSYRQVVRSDRTTLHHRLRAAGQHDAAQLVLKL